MYIDQDMSKVTGAIDSRTVYDAVLFFPHTLTDEQQKKIDTDMLTDVVRDAHYYGIGFSNVNVRFTENVDDESGEKEQFVMVSLVSSKEVTALDEQKIAEAMDNYMERTLSMEMQDTAGKQDDVSDGYRICLHGTPLTVPIADPGRANLAYNMLRFMGNEGAECTINGRRNRILPNNLSIMGMNGRASENEGLDPEWFGSIEDNARAKEAALDKQFEKWSKEGNFDLDDYDRDYESDHQDKYSVGYMTQNGRLIHFAPATWDADKAADMQNLMAYGIEPHVSLFVEHNSKISRIKGNTYIVDDKNGIHMDQYNKNWANEVVSDTADEMDFADAVASILGDEQTLGQ